MIDRAILGGITLKELNNLELEFLFGIEFDLMVKPDEYEIMVARLRQGKACGSKADERLTISDCDGPQSLTVSTVHNL